MQEQMNLEISQEDGLIALLAEELKNHLQLLLIHLMIFLSKLNDYTKRNLIFVMKSDFFNFL